MNFLTLYHLIIWNIWIIFYIYKIIRILIKDFIRRNIIIIKEYETSITFQWPEISLGTSNISFQSIASKSYSLSIPWRNRYFNINKRSKSQWKGPFTIWWRYHWFNSISSKISHDNWSNVSHWTGHGGLWISTISLVLN